MKTLVAVLLLGFGSVGPSWADWEPTSFSQEEVLEFFTVNEEGEEHWATVWFVVLDGEVYLRLGDRAKRRLTESVNKPYVKVRVAEREFEHVLAEEAADKVGQVADLMYEKYWSAFFIKLMPDRYTVRLRPGGEPDGASGGG